ncbi:MAG: hypothetical protein DRJ05_04170 [Bacteroidetes bacterium]|nr:MAG: hypothetical protein DRJ05_04170 [Bacteroidota bacterium]
MLSSIHIRSTVVGLLIVCFTATGLLLTAQDDNNAPVPFTLADRDRIMRTEQQLNSLEKSMGERFAAQEKSMDERFTNINNLLYIILAAIIGLVGFVLWDRRTFLKPVTDKNTAMEQRLKNVIESLREKAKKDSELATILRMNNLL